MTPEDPHEHLYDVHFFDAAHGLVVGIHSIWFTDNGGTTWSQLVPIDPNTQQPYNLETTDVELYAIDVVVRADDTKLGIIVGQPGIVFVSTYDPTIPAQSGNEWLVDWTFTWDIRELCGEGECGTGVLRGCECDICSAPEHVGPWFEAWDVEISEHSTDPVALMVGGVGAGCGMVFSSTDGIDWTKEYHECKCTGTGCLNCEATSVYAQYHDDPDDPDDLTRHTQFKTLYGIGVFDDDNSALASGYNGQQVVRDPATGVWNDRSVFSPNVPTTQGSVMFPLVGGEALVMGSGTQFGIASGMGGHLRESVDGGNVWSNEAVGEPHRIHHIFFKNEDEGWHVGQLFRIAKTIDGGFSWTEQDPTSAPSSTGSFQAVTFASDGLTGVAVGDPFVDTPAAETASRPKIRYTDSGGAAPGWDEDVTILATPAFRDGKALLDVTWSGGSEFWAIGEGGLILNSTNDGQTWRAKLPESATVLSDFELRGVAFLNSSTGLFAGQRPISGGALRGAVYQYQDPHGSASWTALSMPLSLEIEGLWDIEI
jgi:photosystem II stability/assembly factor-like uncharacterized protein